MMGTMPGITVGFVLSEEEKNKSVQVVFVFMFEKLKKAKRLDLFTDWPAGGGGTDGRTHVVNTTLTF